MKHLKEYSSFQEGLFWKTGYDVPINNLYKRLNDIFDMSKLEVNRDNNPYIFTYRLEETDSQSGYIEIYIRHENDENKYLLKIDGEYIDCSHSMKKKIFNFFMKKWKNRVENQKKMQLAQFRKKYNL